MTRDDVLEAIRAHLADELELDPARIDEGTHFKRDLEADSLDLYTLVQELEDTYGVAMSDEQAARIQTVGAAVDFVLDHGSGHGRAEALSPEQAQRPARVAAAELARQAVTHASWTEQRSDSYERLAFLGDSVLSLAITTHLYPRLAAESHGAGQLTKIRAQAVSGRSCRAVAERLGLPERLRAAAPPDAGGPATALLVRTERVLASVIEAVIGACYLAYGYEQTAPAVVEAFGPEIEQALVQPGGLQVRAAGAPGAARGARALRGGGGGRPAARPHLRGLGDGRGRRGGARLGALEEGRRAGGGRRRARRAAALRSPRAPEVDLAQGLQVVPRPHAARVLARRVGGRGPERLGQVQHHRRGAVGAGRAVAARGPRPVDAGRHLRRRARRAGALGGRGRGRARQRRRRRRPAGERGRDQPPARPRGGGRVPRQRRALPARGRARAPVRHRPRQGDALGRLPGPRRADRHLQAARPAAADRGGRGARQAPQAPPPRPAQAHPHAGQPRPRAGHRARGARAAAAAQAPGRGGRAARAPRAPDRRGALDAGRGGRPHGARRSSRRRWSRSARRARPMPRSRPSSHACARAREQAERALAARGSEREALANRAYAARSAAERMELRLEAARAAVTAIEDRTPAPPRAARRARGRGGRGRGRRPRRRRARRGHGGRARAARPGPPRTARAGPGGAGGAPRGRRGGAGAAVGRGRPDRRGAPRRRRRVATPPAERAARSTRASSAPAARPPRSAPTSPPSTSSCARTSAHPAALRRWPMPCGRSRDTSWRSPRRSGRGCGPRWPRTWARRSRCSTGRARTAAPRWCRPSPLAEGARARSRLRRGRSGVRRRERRAVLLARTRGRAAPLARPARR